MRRLISKRPSAASVLALIALFAALGGTSYAAATISGKQVKNGSLTGLDVKNRSLSASDVKGNTLTGGQINESKLGRVPSAANAAQATQADNAKQADSAKQAQKATSADTALQAEKALTADTATKADSVGPNGVDSAAIQPAAVKAADLGSVTIRQTAVVVPTGTSTSAIAGCQAGERALNGGNFWANVTLNNATAAQLHTVYSRPTGNSWQARGYNNSGDNDAELVVYATCLG